MARFTHGEDGNKGDRQDANHISRLARLAFSKWGDAGGLLDTPPVAETPMLKDPHRLEIRADFPATFSLWEMENTVARLRELLLKEGLHDHPCKRINIAYPQKNPDLHPHHIHKARARAQNLQAWGKTYAPDIEWRLASEIVEDIKLDRSRHQDSLYALTTRQEYTLRGAGRFSSFRFVDPAGKPELFVLADDCVEQGTTLGNLMSYVEKSGGKVIAATAEGYADLPQNRRKTHVFLDADGQDCRYFDPSRNTGRLPQLAKSFAESAAGDGLILTPQKCMDIFEGRLNLFGNSVFAMTDGECNRLINTLEKGGYYGKQTGFKELIKKLDEQLARYAEKPVLPVANFPPLKSG